MRRLPGYLTMSEAAEWLGVSRQMMHKHLYAGRISGVVYVGPEDKPLYLLPHASVAMLLRNRRR